MLLEKLKKHTKTRYGAAFIAVCLSMVPWIEICYGNESTQTVFLKKAFRGIVPNPEYVWITPTVRPTIEAILSHEYRGMRIQYWRENDRVAWILETIAKDTIVRAGIVVSRGKIQKLEILSAEGSYGSLVKNDQFTGQFENVGADENTRLTRSIDGISGATFSVNAVSRLARLSLALDHIRKTESN